MKNDHARFTPDLPGIYRFALEDVGKVIQDQLVLQVDDWGPKKRFRNHYLPPYAGVTKVDDDLWTANGSSYTVSKLSRTARGAWQKTGEIQVGSWPGAVAWQKASPYLLVAHRGSDTLGFIDTRRMILIDSVWVGDEPTEIIISNDGKLAFVSLPTMGKLAVVAIQSRRLIKYIDVGFDPRAMSLSSDGKLLFVASYRSRNQNTDLYGSYPEEVAGDIWIIDVKGLSVLGQINDVSAVNRSLYFDGMSSLLWVAATNGDPYPNQGDYSVDEGVLPFVHELVGVQGDPANKDFGRVVTRVDLSHQPSSSGPFVGPSGVVRGGEYLWLSAVSSNQVIALDHSSREEVLRVNVGKGPRRIINLGGGVLAVHCYQSLELWLLSTKGQVLQIISLAEDSRSPLIAQGEQIFYQPGNLYASNHSCDSCHLEGQNEGMIWRFGSALWSNVRPLQLLAATPPHHWYSYVANSSVDAIAAPASIVAQPLSANEAKAMTAFMDSLIGAPRANGATNRDGSFTLEAEKGKVLFEGEAQCVACHSGPVFTNQTAIPLPSGKSLDVPSLLGAYRHGIYFEDGRATTLKQAVNEFIDRSESWGRGPFSDQERQQILAFVSQLTAKGSAPGGMFPEIYENSSVYPNVQPWVEFFDPIDQHQLRLNKQAVADYITLLDSSGQAVDVEVSVEGLRIVASPKAGLQLGERYQFKVLQGLPFITGGQLTADRIKSFVVATNPQYELPKNLYMEVSLTLGSEVQIEYLELQGIRLANGGLGFTMVPLTTLTDQRENLWLRLDGHELTISPFAFPFAANSKKWGPRPAVGNAQGVRARLVHEDAGVFAEGSFAITAPGRSIAASFRILMERPAVF
ncbi:hypothetical protein [Pseudobacteriovorax antillogorgiicola]|nr:hypothetical protein [Pseudobacteriovorax antillogorgiicola]